MKIKSIDEIPEVRDYLERIGAEARSIKTAVVKEKHGDYWTDKAVIRFTEEGDITVTSANTGQRKTKRRRSRKFCPPSSGRRSSPFKRSRHPRR